MIIVDKDAPMTVTAPVRAWMAYVNVSQDIFIAAKTKGNVSPEMERELYACLPVIKALTQGLKELEHQGPTFTTQGDSNVN